nr:MAG TPA: hypothetical protein [Caudoviricetes sp.]
MLYSSLCRHCGNFSGSFCRQCCQVYQRSVSREAAGICHCIVKRCFQRVLCQNCHAAKQRLGFLDVHDLDADQIAACEVLLQFLVRFCTHDIGTVCVSRPLFHARHLGFPAAFGVLGCGVHSVHAAIDRQVLLSGNRQQLGAVRVKQTDQNVLACLCDRFRKLAVYIAVKIFSHFSSSLFAFQSIACHDLISEYGMPLAGFVQLHGLYAGFCLCQALYALRQFQRSCHGFLCLLYHLIHFCPCTGGLSDTVDMEHKRFFPCGFAGAVPLAHHFDKQERAFCVLWHCVVHIIRGIFPQDL